MTVPMGGLQSPLQSAASVQAARLWGLRSISPRLAWTVYERISPVR